MAEVKFFKSILEDSYESFVIEPGMTVEQAVRKCGDDEAYSSNLVECYDLDTGKTFYAPLTDDSDFGVVAVVNGKDVSTDYVFQKNDSAVIMILPHSGDNPDGTKNWSWAGAGLGALIGGLLFGAVGFAAWGTLAAATALPTWGAIGLMSLTGSAYGFIAGGFVGADIYNRKNKKKDADPTQLPDVGGASNQPITGNPIPLVIGKKEISPFIIGSPYVEYKGVGGKDAWIHVLYCVGYGPLKLSDFKFDCLRVTSNPRGVIRGILSGSEIDGGDIKVKWNYNSPVFEIIQQDTNSKDIYYGDIYPVSKKQVKVEAKPMFIRSDLLTDDALYDSSTKKVIQYMNSDYDNGFRTNSIRFSEQYAKKLEVVIDMPEGVYYEKNTSDNIPERKSVPLYIAVQWRPYSEEASKKESDGDGSVTFRSDPNHGYDYRDSRKDGWITFDWMYCDTDKAFRPVTFTDALRVDDISKHKANNLHSDASTGTNDFSNDEVVAELKKLVSRVESYEVTEKENQVTSYANVFMTYKQKIKASSTGIFGRHKEGEVGFKLKKAKGIQGYDDIKFEERDRIYYFSVSDFNRIRYAVYGSDSTSANSAFLSLTPNEYGNRAIRFYNAPYRGNKQYLSKEEVIKLIVERTEVYTTVTVTRTKQKTIYENEIDIDYTTHTPMGGPRLITDITFKNGKTQYNFETKDKTLILPAEWNSDFPIPEDLYNRLNKEWDGSKYYRTVTCKNWPIHETQISAQDYCNENWVGSNVFNLQSVQDYVSSEVKGTDINKGEVRVTFTADIEKFCKDNNIDASSFIYGPDNSTKAIDVRVVRISPNYINEIADSNNKYPKTFHDSITWKTLTSEVIDIDDVNKEFDEKKNKGIQAAQDLINGNVRLNSLYGIANEYLKDAGWDIDDDILDTITNLYTHSYYKVMDGVNYRIFATPVGDTILSPVELEEYVDRFVNSGEDVEERIVFYHKEENKADSIEIGGIMTRVFYEVDQFYKGEDSSGVNKFISSHPISNRHYRNACLVALRIKADNTGNIQGQIDKLSVIAQAFQPKLNNNVWYPEGITKKKRYFLGTKIELLDTDEKTAQKQYEEAIANGDTKATCINGGNNWREKIDSVIFKPHDVITKLGNNTYEPLYENDDVRVIVTNSNELYKYSPGSDFTTGIVGAGSGYRYCYLYNEDTQLRSIMYLEYSSKVDLKGFHWNINAIISVKDIVIENGNDQTKSSWYLSDESHRIGSEEAKFFGTRDYTQIQVSDWCYEGCETDWSNFSNIAVNEGELVYMKVYNTSYKTNHILYIRATKTIDMNQNLEGIVVAFRADHENNSVPSAFIFGCIGPHLGKDALGYEDVNLLSMAVWHDNSIAVIDGSTYPGTNNIAEIFMECNGYVYSKLKLEDLLSKIAVSGRAGYTRGDDGKLVAVMDCPVPYPKGILNNQNALSVTISYNFLPAPSGVLMNFKNAENFGIDEGLMVMNDDEDFRNPTGDVEMQSLDFVTSVLQAHSLGRYYLANKEFSRNAINWKAGIEGFDLQYGDVIKVNHDMLLVGQSCGRITEIIQKDGKAYGLILSDTYEYDGKPEHAIEVMQPSKYGKDRVIVIPVNNTEVNIEYFNERSDKMEVFTNPKVGIVNFVSFDEPITINGEYTIGETAYFFKPEVDNLVNYGFRDKVSRLYRIRSKAPDSNFTFTFNLVPYSERFYDYGCAIPAVNRNITIPSRTSDSEIKVDDKATLNDVLERMEEVKSYVDEAIAEATFDATAVYQLAIATPVLTKNPDGTYVKDELVLKSKKTSGTTTEVYPTIYHVTYFDSENVEQHLYDSATPDVSVTLTNLPQDTLRFHISANYLNEENEEVEFDNQDIQIIESGEQGYTVGLTNENHGFPGDTEKALESVATTSVYALSGNKPVDVRIISIDNKDVSLDFVDTSIPGLKFRVSSIDKAERPSITFKATPELITLSGNVSVIIEVDDIQIEKAFSFTVSRKGEDGDAPYVLMIEGSNIIRNGDGSVTLTPSLMKGGKEITIIPPETKIQWYLDDVASDKAYAAGNYVHDAKLELTAKDVKDKVVVSCKLEDLLRYVAGFDDGSPDGLYAGFTEDGEDYIEGFQNATRSL